MSEILNGKVAVVTGSGQGIGRAIAIALAKHGAAVVTNNRKKGSTGFAILKDTDVKSYSQKQKEYLKGLSYFQKSLNFYEKYEELSFK